MRYTFGVFLVIVCGVVSAQDDARPAPRSSEYIYFAGGGLTSSDKPGKAVHFGGGLDVGVARGLGVGLEGGFGGGTVHTTAAWGHLALGTSYHFLHHNPCSADPFVTGGYTAMVNGKGSTNSLGYFGAGVNFWGSGRTGLRLEFRDAVGQGTQFLHAATGAIHFWQIRVGLAIR